MFIDALSTVFTTIFLLVVISYYALILIPRRKKTKYHCFATATVIVPAHNEERHIKDCVHSILRAKFTGEKKIILVNDGSGDSTLQVMKTLADKYDRIRVIDQKHSGKAKSINTALQHAKGELVYIVDADSTINRDALEVLAHEVSSPRVAAATGVVKVMNRKTGICVWYHIEQLYNSFMRSMMSKVNANITTPGPISVYRKKELDEIGGFSTEGFSEDVDVTIRLIRAGYDVGFSDQSYAETFMPHDAKGIWRQRTRFARGMLNIFKRHLRIHHRTIDLYTLPLFVFTYIQSVIMGSITIYKITSGYMMYFVQHGTYFSVDVMRFFFEWFSMWGFLKWTFNVLSGVLPLDVLSAVGIASTLLSYPLYLAAIVRYDRKIDFYHIFALFFISVFWLFIMVIYIVSLPELFKKEQYNIWKKNEP